MRTGVDRFHLPLQVFDWDIQIFLLKLFSFGTFLLWFRLRIWLQKKEMTIKTGHNITPK
jgi:hypothetical protein